MNAMTLCHGSDNKFRHVSQAMWVIHMRSRLVSDMTERWDNFRQCSGEASEILQINCYFRFILSILKNFLYIHFLNVTYLQKKQGYKNK